MMYFAEKFIIYQVREIFLYATIFVKINNMVMILNNRLKNINLNAFYVKSKSKFYINQSIK